ncbi:hypothetical protein SteCoe_4553 [Stentor coeruleus]|uniref:Dickkopf N-terminal cysteine-rich domain-containing protein n=1 Tax=Stentor coeruleus TaxID=5963 RepID=A0A1R2CUJ1_9CILI|nr:hypothetical protein SteCoe_4553 [Stentor coeruleus]
MLFILLLSTTRGIKCNSYKCAPSTFSFLSASSCLNQTNTTIYLRPCDNENICNLETTLCEPKPASQIFQNYPGEYCKSSFSCLSNSCINSTCIGKSLNQQCTDNEDCNPGLRCFNQKCISQILSGQSGCSNDYDCINSAGCNISSTSNIGICLDYLSISTGSIVSDCSGGQSRLCKTSECTKVGKFGTYGACKLATQSLGNLPVVCTDNLNCTGTDGKYSYTGLCTCGYNDNATAYCNLFNGDLPGVNYYNMWKNSLNASVNACNTLRRFSTECLNKTSYLGKITYSTWNFLFYPQIQNNDACVQETILYQYYGTPSSSLFLSMSLLVLTFFN